jgi:uncharacterized glyoxalase superfamily protein PhnB
MAIAIRHLIDVDGAAAGFARVAIGGAGHADAPPGQFTEPAGFCVATEFDDVADGERVFNALAQNGRVQMAFQETFWAKGFGMLIDQFGTP